jgi:hypothetical protein
VSTFDDELRLALKAQLESGLLLEAGSAADILRTLSKRFPTSGSKIDWDRVPGAIERSEANETDQLTEFVDFFDEVRTKFNLIGPVIYAGDGPTDLALQGSLDEFRRALSEILTIPQHHYFVGANYAWCLAFTMEGDMAFGHIVRPGAALH